MGASKSSTTPTADASDAKDAAEPSLGDGDARSGGVVEMGEGQGAGVRSAGGGEEPVEAERDVTWSASGTSGVAGAWRGVSGEASPELSGCTTTRTRAG
jgi:hypothetical protein